MRLAIIIFAIISSIPTAPISVDFYPIEYVKTLYKPLEAVVYEEQSMSQLIVENAQETVKSTSGGDLKARIIACESGGSYTAQNPKSTASGRYQFLDTTWNNYKGYPKARLAPPEIQDEYFDKIFSEQGSTPWNASRHCWG